MIPYLTDLLDRFQNAYQKIPSKLRHGIGIALGLGLTPLLFYLLFREINAEDIVWREWIAALGFDTLAVVAVLLAITIVPSIWIWSSILKTFDPKAASIKWHTHLSLYLTTALAKRLPGALWHVASRSLLYERLGVRKRAVVASSAMEVVVGTGSGTLLALLFLPNFLRLIADNRLLVVAVIMICGIALLSLHPRVMQHLGDISNNAGAEVVIPHHVQMGWILAACSTWVIGGLMLSYLVSQIQPIGWNDVPNLFASWLVATLLATVTLFLPAGFGISELSLAYFLSFVINPAEAAFVVVVIRVIALLWEAILALIALLILLFQRKFTHLGE